MSINSTFMRKEILDIPGATEKLLRDGRLAIETAAKELRAADPAFASTVARGSSDHAGR